MMDLSRYQMAWLQGRPVQLEAAPVEVNRNQCACVRRMS